MLLSSISTLIWPYHFSFGETGLDIHTVCGNGFREYSVLLKDRAIFIAFLTNISYSYNERG